MCIRDRLQTFIAIKLFSCTKIKIIFSTASFAPYCTYALYDRALSSLCPIIISGFAPTCPRPIFGAHLPEPYVKKLQHPMRAHQGLQLHRPLQPPPLSVFKLEYFIILQIILKYSQQGWNPRSIPPFDHNCSFTEWGVHNID